LVVKKNTSRVSGGPQGLRTVREAGRIQILHRSSRSDFVGPDCD